MLHNFICLLLILSSLLVSISRNPIESVVWLIFAFINTAFILFFFNVEFLALIFIIVYVGAIAVLFLFVIMMLNIKIQKNSFLQYNIIIQNFIKCSIIYSFFLVLFFLFEKMFSNEIFFNINYTCISTQLLDTLNNIDVLAQVLFNYFSSCFLLAGLLLLLALLGAIVLTLNFNSFQKGQLITKQLSNNTNAVVFRKKN